MGFGPSSKFPTMGMVPPSRFAPMGMVQDPEEMAMMMGAQNRPRVAQHAQPGPMPPQASASPIQAPKDRGMFGRFMGILANKPYGGEQMGWVERLGRGPAGMNAVRDEIRADKKAAEEEARRRAMAQQLGVNPELFAMDPAMAMNAKYRGEDTARDDKRYTDETAFRDKQWLTNEQRYENRTRAR
jgi:hypothetical protein